MSNTVMYAILVTSIATYLSRFFGVISSKNIKETSKIFRWFNCLAYSTLAALITRIIIFPEGDLSDVDYTIRFLVILISIIIFFVTKRSVVYPTVFSAFLLSFLNYLF